jgi:hypothetical protein
MSLLFFFVLRFFFYIENILFNLPYIEERYRRTLEVCALVSDLKILEDGDESEIGERGVRANSLNLLYRNMMSKRSIGQSVWWTKSSW